MDILDNVKDVYALIKKLGNQELVEKMLDLKDQIFELREENRNLKEKLSEQESYDMYFEDNMYWDANKKDGPYCSKCWDDNKKAIHLHKYNGIYYCPVCNNNVSKEQHNTDTFVDSNIYIKI
ncbi:MAG: hypothetical protein J6K16_05925 [Alphaproteobacteria bacterium]|nr:hypothetical protein [Alphaproteobacteria bacterium]